jgi:hypothetical protein
MRSTRKTLLHAVYIVEAVQTHTQMGGDGKVFWPTLRIFRMSSLLIYVSNGLDVVCIYYTNLLIERFREERQFPLRDGRTAQNMKLFP